MDPNERLQRATEEMISSVAKTHLRPMHKKAFLCSAKCCDRLQDASHEEFQNCVSTCQQAPSQAEKMLSTELQNFQQRIQRCAMDCRDRAQDELPTDTSKHTPELMSKLQGQVGACVNKCVDSHLGTLKQVEKRFKSTIANF